ncbi:hypothetical protein J437_LFUL003909 [Ladona fulva]|uniref:Molybdopterin synthase catalytic subunit n=1 Tax=Ladona fulva TaxID=123851 RepID=A0A8K0K647_LADFU|nr:hypothetical protein J437_LFUL003909 [Ladona fulva]
MDFIKIVDAKLNLEEISELVTKSTCGAVSFFVGTTREYFEDKKVIHLEYEAYEAMALKAIKGICEQIRNKWKVENIAIFHRIGVVPVKEASVIIAVSSVHRTDSLQAVQYAIDSLKAGVPIWKKEVYEIASAEWKENQESSNFYALEEHSYIKTEDKPHPFKIEEQSVPSHLIQIKADADEIKNRIEKFIKRKREGIDQGNVRDFCPVSGTRKKESSCARVDAVLIRRKDSKSHLRVTRVLNKWGPQTMGLDPGSVGDPTSMKTFTDEKNTPEDTNNQVSNIPHHGIEERLSDVENYLEIQSKSIPKDVYARLKQIEDKILYLESISPEYSVLEQTSDRPLQKEFMKSKKIKVYSINDVEKKIKEIEMQLTAKCQ